MRGDCKWYFLLHTSSRFNPNREFTLPFGGRKTWSYKVYEIFKMCNLSNIFEMKEIFNLKDIIYKLKISLHQKQIEYLKTECQTKPKLRTFILFKDFDNTPSYITQTLNFHPRRQLAMLILGCLPLQIEVDRYKIPKIPENLSFCRVCPGSNLLESEYHFLFICKAYNQKFH